MLAVFALLVSVQFGCAKPGMGSPQTYGTRPATTAASDSTEQSPAIEGAAASHRTGKASKAETRQPSNSPDRVPDERAEQTNKLEEPQALLEHFHVGTDPDDSASAVDDYIWRQFDLAEEYHAMGVVANREASWEEAQYYFEKGLKILAGLDIESDSAMTPEAVRYTRLLEDIVADYRMTLRSLGHLTGDVSAAAVIERFGDIASNLRGDSMLVYKREVAQVTYDIPIIMNDRVKSSIVYFQTVAKEAFYKYLRRSKKYTPMMKRILAEYNLPLDMIYLSLIESGYNPNAYSWARAMGLWQFISSTGRLYGLKRNWWLDERKDPVKATRAAATFLKELYQKFGSWELAWAAYNGGPGRVSRTIKKQKTIDFWKLKLRRQTMDYVPLIMAAAIIAKSPEQYGFYDIEFENEIVWEEVTINRCLDLKEVAKGVGCSVKEIKELNPELLRNYTPPDVKNYKLKVPVGSTAKFYAAYEKMPSPKETSWVRHKIKRGETVSTIAAKYGVSQYSIFESNNLRRRSRIYAGKTLIVPVPLDREYQKSRSRNKNKKYAAKNSIYAVRSGDTMWDIARAFGTSVNALRSINYIERGSRIYVGQKLKIPSSATLLARSKSPGQRPRTSGSSNLKSSTVPVATASTPKKYKVRVGDTLWDIARKYGTTTAKLRRLNGLGRSSRIYPGQVLSVQSGEGKDYVIHRVKKGESLSRIANRYRTSIARIIANNNIADPDRLSVDAKLRIYTK